jgi:hypothetical protein
MKNTYRFLAPVSCLLLSISLPSLAVDFRQPVQFSGNTASGSLQVVRNTYDEVQFIGCRVDVNLFQTAISCVAQPVTGSQLSCNLIQPDKKFLRAVYSISDSSYITFTKDSVSSECTEITVKNGGITY